jgi:hypothetical protein
MILKEREWRAQEMNEQREGERVVSGGGGCGNC